MKLTPDCRYFHRTAIKSGGQRSMNSWRQLWEEKIKREMFQQQYRGKQAKRWTMTRELLKYTSRDWWPIRSSWELWKFSLSLCPRTGCIWFCWLVSLCNVGPPLPPPPLLISICWSLLLTSGAPKASHLLIPASQNCSIKSLCTLLALPVSFSPKTVCMLWKRLLPTLPQEAAVKLLQPTARSAPAPWQRLTRSMRQL